MKEERFCQDEYYGYGVQHSQLGVEYIAEEYDMKHKGWGIQMKRKSIMFASIMLIIMTYIILIGNNVVFASYSTGTCDRAACNKAPLRLLAGSIYKDATNHGSKATCPKCGAVYWGNLEGHRWSWKSTGAGASNQHYQKCSICGGEKNRGNHSYGSYKKSSETQHKTTCTTSGCPSYMVSSHTETTAATCTSAAYCATCKSNYGSVNSTNHDYSKACPTCGTANIVCSRCGTAQAHTCDTTAPTSGTFQDAQIRYTNATDGNTFRVHVSGVTDTGSGVEGLYLWVSNNGVASWNILEGQKMNTWYDAGSGWYDVPIRGEGTYVIRVHSRDNAGNWNWSNPAVNINGTAIDETVIVDRTAPYVNSITYDPGWKNTSITKDVTFSDALSGMQKIEYSYDNSTWYSDWASSTLSADGKQLTVNRTWSGEQNNVLWFRAIDNTGNVYTYPGAYDLKIDTTAPTASDLTLSTTYTNTGKLRATAQGVSDNLSGVNRVQWFVRKSDWSTGILDQASTGQWYYDIDVTSLGEGTYIVGMVITDNAGNGNDTTNSSASSSYIGWKTFYYDTTGPNHGYFLDGTPRYTNAADGTTFRVHAQGASDSLSGVDAMYLWVSTDGGASWNKINGQRMNEWDNNGTRAWYYDVTISGEGTYLCHTCPLDKAGNWTWGGPYESVIVDRTLPTVSTVSTSQYYYGNGTTSVPVTISGMSDNLSGLKTLHYAYYVPGAPDWVYTEIANTSATATINIPISTEGEYTVAVKVIDNAGNWSNNTSDTYGYLRTSFVYDATAPTASDLTLSTTYTNTGKLRATAQGVSDNLSGVNRVQWYVRKSDWSTGILDQASTGQWYYDIDVTSLGEGTYIVGMVITDNAGNVNDTTQSGIGWKTFYYDKTAPTGSASIPKYTTTGQVTVTVNATDTNGSGMLKIQYPTWSVANGQDDLVWYETAGAGPNYTYTVDLTKHAPGTEGKYNIHVYAADNAYNSGYIYGQEVIYDKTAPVVESVPAMQIYNQAGKQVTFSIKVADNLSGINPSATIWHIYAGNTLWSTVGNAVYDSTTHMLSQTVTLPDGSDGWSGNCIFNARPVIYDNAGNYIDIRNDTNKQIQVMIDTTPPTYSNFTPTGTVYTNNPNYQVTTSVNVADSGGSEVKIVNLSAFYGTSWQGKNSNKVGRYNSNTGKYEATYTLNEIMNSSTGATNNGEGTYIFDGSVGDGAGNYTWLGMHTVVLDTTAPTVEVSNIAYSQNASIKLTDALAGIKYFAVTTNTTAPTSTGSSNVTTGNQLNYWYQVYQTTSATTVTFTGLEAGTYYAWGKDATGNQAYKQFTVDKKEITVNWGNTAFLFNAKTQLPTATCNSGVTGETINLSITGAKTDVGTYTATATINSVSGGKNNINNYRLANPTVSFTISPDPNITFDVTLDKYYYVWDNTEHKPTPTVKVTVSGTVYTLVKDRDYTVSYKENIEPSENATVVITGINNYAASNAEIKFTIDKALRGANVLMDNYYYATILPTPELDHNDEPGVTVYYYNTVDANTNGIAWSTVTDSSYLDAGVYYMYATIEETTHYKAEITSTKVFEVLKGIAIHPAVENKVYNGSLQIGVFDSEGIVLTGITEATDVGTYTAYGTIANNYEWAAGDGPKVYTWSIEPRDINETFVTADPLIFAYDRTAHEPDVTIKYSDFELVEGKDYTVSFKDNIDVGEAELVITGIGNFTGVYSSTFYIEEVALSRIELDKAEYNYTGSEVKPIEKVYDTYGNLLIKDRDYTLYYTSNVDIGTAIIGAIGKGNYQGVIETNFEIVGDPLDKAKVTLKGLPFIYDGEEKCPGAEVVLNGKTLVRGRDYEISYENNINAGENTAVAIITGKGNYVGTVNKNFTIMKANRKATILPGKGIIVGDIGEISYSYKGEEAETVVTISDTTVINAIDKTYSANDVIKVTGLKAGKTLIKLTVATTNNYNELILNSEVTVFEKPEDTYPIYGTVIINDDEEYTVTPRTMLTLNVDFGDYMYISESNVTPSIDDSEWYEFSRKIPYVFDDAEGEKTIYVWFKDKKGNMSEMATDSIILDYDADIPANDHVMLDQTNINVTGPDVEYYKYHNSSIDVKVIFKQEDVMVNGIRSGVNHTTIKYGYKLAEDTSGNYIWQDTPIVEGLSYNKLYAFVTQAYDRAGNGATISEETLIQTERKYETKITLKDTNAQYDGKVQSIAEAEFTIMDGIEITGNVIYTYYVDKDCTILTNPDRDGSITEGGAPSKPGIYYVKAELVEDQVYYDAVSNVAELRIGWEISKTTSDDVFAYLERTDPNKDEYILKVIGDGNMTDLDDLLNKNSDESLVYWSDYKDKIVELEIINEGNDSINNIGSDIFNNLTNITEINIPDTIVKIGDYAFEGCTGVTGKIVIPISVEEIGAGAFSNVNTSEFEVAYGNSNYDTIDGVLTDSEKKELVAYPNGKADEKYTIPNTITTIKESAFSGSDNLKDVVIPNGVEIIENKAFYDCPNLKVVEIEDLMGENDNVVDLRVIGNKAFEDIGTDSIIYTFSEDIAKKFADGKTHTEGITKVYWPPVITLHPIDMNGALGMKVKFIVEAKAGYPEEIKYQWFKVNGDIEGVISSATNNEYTTSSLTGTNYDDCYYCRVYNVQYYYDRGFVNSNKAKLTMLTDANYIVERGTYNSYLFERLEDAFDFAKTDDVIKPLKTVYDETDAILTGNKSITLDLNANTINLVGTITIDSNAKLNVVGTGDINKSGDYVFENKGELKLNGTFNIENSTGHAIKSLESSKLGITSGNITVDSNAIYAENAEVIINGVNANIVALTSSQNANAVSLYKDTKFTMTEGNISISYETEMNNGIIYGVYVEGDTKATTKISGGTIKAISTNSDADAIANAGTSDITISGTVNVEGSRSGIITVNSDAYGDIIVQGGIISGGEFGILNNATVAKVILGKEGGGVSITTPVIIGEKAAIFNTKENDKLEFYDGILYSHGSNVIYEELNNTNLNISSSHPDSVYTEAGRDTIKTESKYSIAIEENVSYNSSTYKAAYLKEDKEPTLSGIQDQTVEEGEKATFEIIATGGQPDSYEYQWEVSTDSGLTWQIVTTGTGANTNKYTTPITTLTMDGYRYRCTVSNGKTKVISLAVTLNVLAKDYLGNQRPIARIIFPDGRIVAKEGIDKTVVNMQIIVKSFDELKSLKVNGEEIFGYENYEFASGLMKIARDTSSPIEIKKEINGEQKVVEYTYTYNVKVYANDIINVEVVDIKNRDNTATQIVDLFYNLKVEYYLSELTQINDKLIITFYANKPVKPIKSVVNSYINGTYLNLVSLDNAEYSYRYSLELYDPLPTTDFWFEDEYKNQTFVTVNEINRVRYKDIKFSDATLQIEDLTVIDAYYIAQDLENTAEVNTNQEIQSRYGLNSVQSDMFMSRARDFGALNILNGSTEAKSYDGVFTSTIKATVTTHDYAYDSVNTTGNLFVAAAAKNIVDNKLSSENRKYVDVISKEVSLYKGMNITNFTINDSAPYMYITPSGVSNMTATAIAKAGFRVTIIAK